MMLAAALDPLRPPPWVPYFRSDDLDEVRAFIGTTDGRQSRVARRGEPLGYALYRLAGLRTNLGGSDSAVEQTVRGLVLGPVLQLSLPVGSVFRVGRRVSAPTGPFSVVIAPPGWEFTRTSPPGSMFAIEVQARALQDEIAARQPVGGTSWAGRLSALDVGESDRACLMTAAADLVRATQPGVDPRQLAVAEGRVVGLMAGLALLGWAEEPPGVLAQERVKDLEHWIEAHLHEPLTLGRLCQAAGVGARCLQKAFEVRRGMSPMRFVAERRLAAAHVLLRRAAPDASVTQIALELGFDHLGRFAQMYRQFIGESPSQTLCGGQPARNGAQAGNRPERRPARRA
jgi:AraC-like DNA-binding protein